MYHCQYVAESKWMVSHHDVGIDRDRDLYRSNLGSILVLVQYPYRNWSLWSRSVPVESDHRRRRPRNSSRPTDRRRLPVWLSYLPLNSIDPVRPGDQRNVQHFGWVVEVCHRQIRSIVFDYRVVQVDRTSHELSMTTRSCFFLKWSTVWQQTLSRWLCLVHIDSLTHLYRCV